MSEKTLRIEVEGEIRGFLADYHHISESEVDSDMVAGLVDVVFDVMRVPGRLQDSEYAPFARVVGVLFNGSWYEKKEDGYEVDDQKD